MIFNIDEQTPMVISLYLQNGHDEYSLGVIRSNDDRDKNISPPPET